MLRIATLLLLFFSAASTGADSACIAPTSDSEDGVPAAKKPRPGHYISLNRRDTRDTIAEVMTPGVKGVQIRYAWASLEPEPGEYDFNEIRADLDAARNAGGRLVVFVVDKTFSPVSPMPDFLNEYALENRAGGYTAMRWHPEIIERMQRLLAAVGEEFDCHEAFEGVALQESALGLSDAVLERNGYSPQKYRAALEQVLLSAAESLPRSRVFWYMNYLAQGQSYLRQVAIRVVGSGVVMGGPDVLPDSKPLAKLVYPLYREFANRMPLFGSIQYDSYAHKRAAPGSSGRYWTLEELFLFATQDLHADYLFWNRKTWLNPAGSFTYDDAVKVIEETESYGDEG